jgi:hypothetical protein
MLAHVIGCQEFPQEFWPGLKAGHKLWGQRSVIYSRIGSLILYQLVLGTIKVQFIII